MIESKAMKKYTLFHVLSDFRPFIDHLDQILFSPYLIMKVHGYYGFIRQPKWNLNPVQAAINTYNNIIAVRLKKVTIEIEL